MSTTTIRVSEKTHRKLASIARQSGKAMAEIVDAAIEQYRRQSILEAGNAVYAALRNNPSAWEELQSERESWDDTLTDGLLEE